MSRIGNRKALHYGEGVLDTPCSPQAAEATTQCRICDSRRGSAGRCRRTSRTTSEQNAVEVRRGGAGGVEDDVLSVLALMVKRQEKGRWSEEDSRGRIIGDAVPNRNEFSVRDAKALRT